jgi:hypothetical protein
MTVLGAWLAHGLIVTNKHLLTGTSSKCPSIVQSFISGNARFCRFWKKYQQNAIGRYYDFCFTSSSPLTGS